MKSLKQNELFVQLLNVCVFGLIMAIISFKSFGQTPIVVKGKYKKDNIYVKYYQGVGGGNDDIVEFESDKLNQLIEENIRLLNIKNNNLKNPSNNHELKTLQEKNNIFKDSILLIQNIIKVNNKQLQELQDTIKNLKSEISGLNLTIGTQLKAITVLNDSIRKLTTNDDYINSRESFQCSFYSGVSFLQSKNIENGFWNENHSLYHNFGLYYESAQLSMFHPVSFGVGLSLSAITLRADIPVFEETVNSLVDADNDTYNAICKYYNISEEASLMYLNIPLTLSYGLPRANRMSGYVKLSVIPSLTIKTRFQGTGSYDISGYYPQWDVVLHDIDELNFRSNGFCYENTQYKTHNFVLWSSLSCGMYYPLGKYDPNNDKSKFLKIGFRFDYSVTTISKYLNYGIIKGAKYQINQSNILSGSGTRIMTPGIEIAFIYTLPK